LLSVRATADEQHERGAILSSERQRLRALKLRARLARVGSCFTYGVRVARMKDLLTALALLLALGGCEGALWMRNPLQIPNGFGPARACGFQVFQELDSSMQPGVSAGHHVLVSAWPYWWKEPQVGDVVAFVYPRDAALADLKRIVAGAGSTVELRQGVLYVDGRPYTSASESAFVGRFHRFTSPQIIPPHSYFMMGDNAPSSEDSRSYGVISRDRIIGKQWL
jgi:signal peptidase I